jgi:hypothetical protein
MSWLAAAGIGVSVATSMFGAKQSSDANRANAQSSVKSAKYNAEQELMGGIYNANMVTASARANNMLEDAAAKIGARDTLDIAGYNANLRQLVGDYNASILESEATLIHQAAGVDVELVNQDVSRRRGDIIASYGASGVQINDTDSVADALVDAQSTAELNKFIIRHGADLQATKLLNEATRSRWDGATAAQQIMYEGNMAAQATLISSGVKQASNTIQGSINSMTIYDNAVRSAASISQGGAALASKYNQQASSAMADGYFKAGAAITSGLIDYAKTK